MESRYIFGITRAFPKLAPLPTLLEFAKALPDGNLYEALGTTDDRDILFVATGPDGGFLNAQSAMDVEVEQDDLSVEAVDFGELWDAIDEPLPVSLRLMLKHDIFAPIEFDITTFKDRSVGSLWTAIKILRAEFDAAAPSDQPDIGRVLRHFALAIEMSCAVSFVER